jgi:hypothetical protein
MKLTDPPFATTSTRISLSISMTFGEAVKALISISDISVNLTRLTIDTQ